MSKVPKRYKRFMDEFPDVAKWSTIIAQMYEDRLHADYDNWSDTNTSFTNVAKDSIRLANDFCEQAKLFLTNKHQVYF